MKYQVVVIGAGLAGLMAVAELSRRKIPYLCIERQSLYRINCGEATSIKRIEDILPDAGKFIESTTQKVVFKIAGKEISLKRSIGHINRHKLQVSLAKNRNIRFGAECKRITIFNKEVLIELPSEKIHAEMVIVAAGFNVSLLRSLGVIPKGYKYYRTVGAKVKVNASLQGSVVFEPLQDRFGAFWMFPKLGSRITAGVSSLDDNKDLRKILRRKLDINLKEYKILHWIAGLTPASGPFPRLVADRLLLCGDSAGFVAASTGEGILYALKSGSLAGCCAALAVQKADFSKKYLQTYKQMIKQAFGRELRRSLHQRKAMYWIYRLGLAGRIACRPGILFGYR